MIIKMKTALYSLIRDLGYNITDQGNYEENFPWLMIRTSNHKKVEAMDVRMDEISLIVDVFSTYQGEKEILEIAENIADNLHIIKDNNPEVMVIGQRSLVIVGDTSKGPVRKHGVITYTIATASYLSASEEEEIENEES